MSYIRTFSGVKFYPLDPNPADVRIEDIAHALSRLCRWVGHVPIDHYSVAMHSMHVSDMCLSVSDQFAGLLHDASEAYLGDIAKPVKALLPDYRVAEHRLMKVVAQALGFEFPLPEIVHQADAAALWLEAAYFSPYAGEDIPYTSPPREVTWDFERFPTPSPSETEECFLETYRQLKQRIHHEKNTTRTIDSAGSVVCAGR